VKEDEALQDALQIIHLHLAANACKNQSEQSMAGKEDL